MSAECTDQRSSKKANTSFVVNIIFTIKLAFRNLLNRGGCHGKGGDQSSSQDQDLIRPRQRLDSCSVDTSDSSESIPDKILHFASTDKN